MLLTSRFVLHFATRFAYGEFRWLASSSIDDGPCCRAQDLLYEAIWLVIKKADGQQWWGWGFETWLS
eukprot:3887934-Amphidinium_carterae.1